MLCKLGLGFPSLKSNNDDLFPSSREIKRAHRIFSTYFIRKSAALPNPYYIILFRVKCTIFLPNSEQIRIFLTDL